MKITEKKKGFEMACAAAVKARDFAAAAKAASSAADCADILASRTAGIVAEAYAKEAASWRELAARIPMYPAPPQGGRRQVGGSPIQGGRRQVGGSPIQGGRRQVGGSPIQGGRRQGCGTPIQGGGRQGDASLQGAASGEEWLVAEKPDITFDDIAGMEEAKRVIEEMVLYPMKAPEKARALGLNPGGGVLLFGPPGTGKTMLGKAIAGALEAPFYYASGADLRSKWYGESEQRLSQLLNAAKAQPVAVVFLDEIESLLPKRTEGSHAADNRVVTQFLADLGGFKDSPNLLLVLGATNKPWDIDEAVFRTGRFDEKIYIGPPDGAAREKILELNLMGAQTADDVDLPALAAAMDGASGSDMAAVVSAAKRAALGRAIRMDAEPILTAADFDEARRRIPLSITEAILAPYLKFMEERF